jgi:hypothetical protein
MCQVITISRADKTVALTTSRFASSPVHAGCMHFSRSITDTWGHFLRPSRSTNLLVREEVPTPQVTEHSDHGPQRVVAQIPSLPSRSSSPPSSTGPPLHKIMLICLFGLLLSVKLISFWRYIYSTVTDPATIIFVVLALILQRNLQNSVISKLWGQTWSSLNSKIKKKSHGLSLRANYTDRATATCLRSDCQILRIEGVTWSVWQIPTAVFSVF